MPVVQYLAGKLDLGPWDLHKEQIYRDLKRYEDLDFSRLAMYEGFCLRRKRACIRLRVVDGIPYILDMCLV